MTNLLFPSGCRVVGWLLFCPALILAALTVLSYFDIWNVAWIGETIVNDAIIIGIALGSLFIVCSKEPEEDEMTRSIRLSAVLNSIYVYVTLLIASTLFINGIEFMQFLMINLVLLPVISVILYCLEVRRYYKMCEDEE